MHKSLTVYLCSMYTVKRCFGVIQYNSKIKLRGGHSMSQSDAQKRAKNKWDGENMKVLGCKIRRDLAEEFQTLAARNGTTPNALMRGWILEYIDQYTQTKKMTNE